MGGIALFGSGNIIVKNHAVLLGKQPEK